MAIITNIRRRILIAVARAAKVGAGQTIGTLACGTFIVGEPIQVR
jgi:hypothetical protein